MSLPRIYLGIPERCIVLCLTPKVGSGSIISAFLQHYGVRSDGVLHLNPALPFMDRLEVERHLPDWRRAMFVRNPFDRLVSCYVFHIQKDRLARANNLRQLGFHTGMTFEEFVRKVASNPDADPHTSVQVRQFDRPADFVGRIEAIDRDWPRFGRFCDIDFGPLPALHVTNTDGRDYRRYYTDETRRLVEKAYAECLDRFGYAF